MSNLEYKETAKYLSIIDSLTSNNYIRLFESNNLSIDSIVISRDIKNIPQLEAFLYNWKYQVDKLELDVSKSMEERVFVDLRLKFIELITKTKLVDYMHVYSYSSNVSVISFNTNKSLLEIVPVIDKLKPIARNLKFKSITVNNFEYIL